MICQITQLLSGLKDIDRYYLEINRGSLASGDSQVSFVKSKI